MIDKYKIPLKINRTDETPLLEWSPKSFTFDIIGISVPKNAKLFYEPILEWIEGYVEDIKNKIIINIDLDYFSTQSLVWLIKILKKFEKIESIVNWSWDEENIKECGEDISTIINIKFNLIQK